MTDYRFFLSGFYMRFWLGSHSVRDAGTARARGAGGKTGPATRVNGGGPRGRKPHSRGPAQLSGRHGASGGWKLRGQRCRQIHVEEHAPLRRFEQLQRGAVGGDDAARAGVTAQLPQGSTVTG